MRKNYYDDKYRAAYRSPPFNLTERVFITVVQGAVIHVSFLLFMLNQIYRRALNGMCKIL